MKLDRYELQTGQNFTIFEFLSIGKNGDIIKVVQFQQMIFENLYNLAFGDKNINTGNIEDKVVTDNGDTDKVLATVVFALYTFTERYPDSWVYATGSTKSRTRLYRMGINNYFEIVSTDFDIMGEQNNEWELYEFGKEYQSFAVHRKNSKFYL